MHTWTGTQQRMYLWCCICVIDICRLIFCLQDPLSPEVAVFREDYKRAAYNALAAAILCTQRKENLFRQFLFNDNEAKKEFLWENIVDLKVT